MSFRHHSFTAGPFRSLRRTAALFLMGLFLGASVGAPATAQDERPAAAQNADPYADHISDAARRFSIPEAWIRAVMRVESRGDRRAVSPKGAMGLMQIMPATWSELRGRYGLGSDPYDPRDNILAGAAFLRELHDRYGSPGFLAAYNAGPGRYEEYRSSGRPLPAETRAYVAVLAPVVNGVSASPVAVSATDRLAWTRSPIFIAQAESSSGAVRPQLDGTALPSSPRPPNDDPQPVDLRTGGLFVLRTPGAGPR